ncbi:hypothetical protein L1987_64560 [Smallanthus sonchifolius]|uniref:Uncharacterized protein n=1 Tax=Smallanthus sonchifolius TaxID=185202 RepID=A0ACB9BS77_9ASTR|nr:hypothetical protein L1987_64560 [Smallanthus sonchifolius]
MFYQNLIDYITEMRSQALVNRGQTQSNMINARTVRVRTCRLINETYGSASTNPHFNPIPSTVRLQSNFDALRSTEDCRHRSFR